MIPERSTIDRNRGGDGIIVAQRSQQNGFLVFLVGKAKCESVVCSPQVWKCQKKPRGLLVFGLYHYRRMVDDGIDDGAEINTRDDTSIIHQWEGNGVDESVISDYDS